MARKPKDPMKVLSMKVSARDRAIYEAVRIQQRTQKAVGIEHGLSQARVSAIVLRVERWLAQPAPAGYQELHRGERLRYVSRRHQMRLEYLYNQALVGWESSRQAQHTVKERTIQGEKVPERTVTLRDGDRRFLREAADINQRMTEFEGFDRYGNVDTSCKGRVYEAPPQTNVELNREVKRRAIVGKFDTPGDEGVPGMWEQEMRQRNAEVAAASPVGRTSGPSYEENQPLSESDEDAVSALSPGDEVRCDSVVNDDKVLYEKQVETAQDTLQKGVTAKTKSEKVLLTPRKGVGVPGPEEDTRPGQDAKSLAELGMRVLGRPLVPCKFFTYTEFPPPRPERSREGKW